MPIAFRPMRLPSYDEESVLAEIKRIVTQHFGGTVPRKEEFDRFSMVKSQTIRSRFGSWANAIRKAGFDYHGKSYEGKDLRRANYSEELMVADLQRIKELNCGQYFSQEFYKTKGGRYSVRTLTKHFRCSWQAILQERLSLAPPVIVRLKLHQIGMTHVSEHSEQELILELQRVWNALGRRPSYAEFKQLSRIGVKVYERRFGNWKTAIARFYAQTSFRSIGLAGSHATPELLLTELRKLTCQVRAHLTFEQYRKLGGSFSIATFQRHFGSWQEAVRRIGRHDGHAGKYADEELFSELQLLWEALGRQPTFQEMNRDGRISGGVFQRRFGSWMKAIHAFCADRESPHEAEIASVPVAAIQIQTTQVTAFVEELAPSPEPCMPMTTTILVDSRRAPGKRLRFRVLQRDGFRCLLCGRSPATHHGVALQTDHIIPWSRGGLTVFENLRTACDDCNGGKSDTLPELYPRPKGRRN